MENISIKNTSNMSGQREPPRLLLDVGEGGNFNFAGPQSGGFTLA